MEINEPSISQIGQDKNGNGEYLVTIYNRGLQTLAIGVSWEEAEKVKQEYIDKQKNQSVAVNPD